jgi:hypothetical protein
VAKTLQDRITFLKDQIAKSVPLFADYLNLSTTLNDYSHSLQKYIPHKIHQERQVYLKEVVESEIKRIFGDSFNINNFDLGNQSVYSVVDHHDILNHQLFISPNILSNIFRFEARSDKQKAIITFSDGGIPVDHFGNRRGMTLHEKPIRIFSHQERHKISYAIPKRDISLMRNLNNEFTSEEKRFIEKINEEIQRLSVSESAESYMDQVTIINRFLWKQLFEEKIREDVPELIHLPGEVIVAPILEKFLRDESGLFHKIVFNESLREKVIDLFDGVKGCWKNDKTYGTHLFWSVNNNAGIERLWISDNKLKTEDGNVEIDLNLETIIDKLKSKEIYPGLFLTYGILIFYFGIKPLTGFASTDYLTKMKNKWIELLNDIDPEESKLVEKIPTNNLIQGPKLIFDYVDGKYKDMYSLDIIYKGGVKKEYLDQVKNMSFNQVLLPGLLDTYKTYISADTSVLNLTLDDLLNESFSWLKK